jgi:GNAT superfamily N-acetyltransferase
VKAEQSPLDYHGTRPKRLAIYEEGFEGTQSYTRDVLGLVAFLDYSEDSRWGTTIHYVFVDDARQGQGHARALIKALYDRTTGDVDWGDIHADEMWHLFQEYRDRKDRYTTGKNYT